MVPRWLSKTLDAMRGLYCEPARAPAWRNWMFASWTMTSAKLTTIATPSQRILRPTTSVPSWCGRGR